MHEGFFRFQHRALGILLGWGLGSMVVGGLLSLVPRPWLRQFGVQALTWGAIDAAIALFGRRSAAKKAEQPLGSSDVVGEALRFRTILLVNALFDLGYIAGGLYLRRRSEQRPERRGMGWGIVVQGLFLFVFDSILTLIVQIDLPSRRRIS